MHPTPIPLPFSLASTLTVVVPYILRPVAQRFAAFMSDYAALHASILDPATPDAERRLLVLDQQAGGLGN
eukprot:1852814-Rhodomonas_salina.1